MTCCAQCTGIEKLFDEKSARRQWKRYLKRGADSATRTLLSMVRPLNTSQQTLLDIGGGIGAIQLELLNDDALPFTSATNVDASTGYQIVAREAAINNGLSDRIAYIYGDFLDVVQTIDRHDLVTLDKVICCYPNMQDLLRHSARKSSSTIVLSYPKDAWWTRLFQRMTTLAMLMVRNPFRMHVHADRDVEKVLVSEGFTQVERRTTIFWQIRSWRRT